MGWEQLLAWVSGIHVGSRKVYVADIIRNPTDDWMRQAARNLTSGSCKILAKCRYQLRGRDATFTAGFNKIMKAAGIEPVPLPPRSPNLNAFAERFVRSIKDECLGRMIFFDEASLRHAVTKCVEHHYCHERAHQGKDNVLLLPQHDSDPTPRGGPIVCRERLGGLLKFYRRRVA